MIEGARNRIRYSRACSPALLLVAALSAVTASEVAAIPVSGTITYTGSRGPVSSTRPIAILLTLPKGDPEEPGDEVSRTFVSVNGGSFILNAPAPGDYELVYFLDLHNLRDGTAAVGAPAEIYNNRFAFPGDVVHVSPGGVSGLVLDLSDAMLLPGIEGKVRYTGKRPAPSIVVQAFANASLSGEPDHEYDYASNGGWYVFVILNPIPTGFYLRAFVDLNLNERLDPGEPFTIYNGKGSSPGDRVLASQTATNVDITFGDEHIAGTISVSGAVRYNGALGPVSPTRPISVFLLLPGDEPDSVDFASVAVNGGAFTLNAPVAGQYQLAYVLDIYNLRDGSVSVGAPAEIYNNQFDFPGDIIHVPSGGLSGLVLDFNDTFPLPGIGGTVTYTGAQPAQEIVVQAFTNPSFAGDPEDEYQRDDNGRYDLIALDPDPGGYYLRAFADVIWNGRLDNGEPYTIYNQRSSPPGDRILASPSQADVNITFGDENIQAPPTMTPSRTPTRTSTVLPSRTPTRSPTVMPTRTPTPSPTPTPTRTRIPTRTPGPHLGDATCDDDLGVADLVAMTILIGGDGPLPCENADATSDGFIDNRDIDRLIAELFRP